MQQEKPSEENKNEKQGPRLTKEEDSGDSGQKSLTRSNQLSCEEEMKVDLIAS